MFQKFLINWKTSSAGVLLIVGAVISLVYAFTDSNSAGRPSEVVLMAQITAIITGFGLIVARDADKSSEETAGVKELEDAGERANK